MVLLSVRELLSTHFSSNVEYCASYTMAREILYYSVNGKLTASCAICRHNEEKSEADFQFQNRSYYVNTFLNLS